MVDFNNKWFRETCEEAGWDPDNALSQSAIGIAKTYAIKMKKNMDAKKNYDDETLQKRFDERINGLNNERINYMLNALTYAEVMAGLGGFDEFIKGKEKRRQMLLKR